MIFENAKTQLTKQISQAKPNHFAKKIYGWQKATTSKARAPATMGKETEFLRRYERVSKANDVLAAAKEEKDKGKPREPDECACDLLSSRSDEDDKNVSGKGLSERTIDECILYIHDKLRL